MADVGQSACFSDPNFAVICSFLQRFGDYIGLPNLSTTQLADDIEDSKGVSELLQQVHVYLMRRILKSVKPEKWQKHLVQICFKFSEVDAWECNKRGYRKLNVATKLRILKFLLESQFDRNNKLREKISELEPDELRFLPIGRDRNGLAYWYLTDNDANIQVYREEQDDMHAKSWQIVCRNRDELAGLVTTLENLPSPMATAENSRAPTPHIEDIKQEGDGEDKEETAKSGIKKDEGNIVNEDQVQASTSLMVADSEFVNEEKLITECNVKEESSLPELEAGTGSNENETGYKVTQNVEAPYGIMRQKGPSGDEANMDQVAGNKCVEGHTGNEQTMTSSPSPQIELSSIGGEESSKMDNQPSNNKDVSCPETNETSVTKYDKGRPKKKKNSQKESTQCSEEGFTPRRSTRTRKPVIVERKEISEDEEEEFRNVKEKLDTSRKTADKKRNKGCESSSDESYKYQNDSESADSDFAPAKRRNIKSKKEEKLVEAGIPDDTPCSKCLKFTHPDMMLLCDKCDAGYHMSCLRPPLLIIPEGDWYCQPCDHAMLIQKLQVALRELNIQIKKQERLLKRKERLAFVGISLNNILPVEKSDSEPEVESWDEERKQNKSRKEQFVKRSCRQRKNINYRFEDYDELINEAIQEDDEEGAGEGGKGGGKDMANITRHEKQISGKDISNIVGLENEVDDNPIYRKKTRKLTALDDDPGESEDDSDEYQVSESMSEQAVDDSFSDGSDISDDWRDSSWRRSRSCRTGLRNKKRKSYRDYAMDDFVVEEYDSEEDEASRRRSTRVQARQKKLKKKSLISSDEELASTPEESDSDSSDDRIKNKWNYREKYARKRKGVIESDSDDSAVVMKSHSKKRCKRYIDDDDYEDEEARSSDEEITKPIRKSERARSSVNINRNILQSDDEDEEDEEEDRDIEEKDDEKDVKGNVTDDEIKLGVNSDKHLDVSVDKEVNGCQSQEFLGEFSDKPVLKGVSPVENKPNESFMIDNLLRDSKPCVAMDNEDELDLEGVTDLISYVTQDESS